MSLRLDYPRKHRDWGGDVADRQHDCDDRRQIAPQAVAARIIQAKRLEEAPDAVVQVQAKHTHRQHVDQRDKPVAEVADHVAVDVAVLERGIVGRMQGAGAAVHHKLEGLTYACTARGCPVLDAAIAWLECEAVEYVVVGDHTLVIGQAVDRGVLREAEPLASTYTGWSYSG
jgi:hypothetical protein